MNEVKLVGEITVCQDYIRVSRFGFPDKVFDTDDGIEMLGALQRLEAWLWEEYRKLNR